MTDKRPPLNTHTEIPVTCSRFCQFRKHYIKQTSGFLLAIDIVILMRKLAKVYSSVMPSLPVGCSALDSDNMS